MVTKRVENLFYLGFIFVLKKMSKSNMLAKMGVKPNLTFTISKL